MARNKDGEYDPNETGVRWRQETVHLNKDVSRSATSEHVSSDDIMKDFKFVIFFTPLNILISLLLIFVAILEFGLKSTWKFFVKLWKKWKNRILMKKHKYDDPYGEEDWTE